MRALSPHDTVPWERAADDAVGPRSTRPLQVLIAEDEPVAREGLARIIRSLGHVCVTAPNGVLALELHRQHPADVVVSDWRMPRLSGVDLCREIRRLDADDHYTYFVFVTALGDKDQLMAGMHAGADEYLVKPIDIDALEAKLVAASRVANLWRTRRRQTMAVRRQSEKLRIAASTDALTGLANRRQLEFDLQALWREHGRPTCVAILDVDRFKDFNDRWGHLAGDQALRKIAMASRAALRTSDTVYRYGGEELLVLFPASGLEEATAAVERLRAAIERLGIPHPDGPAGIVTVSGGVAERNDADDTPEHWLARADAALYSAKSLGRNRVEHDDGPKRRNSDPRLD